MEIVKNGLSPDIDEQEFKKLDIRGDIVSMKRFVQEPAGHITLEDFPAGCTHEVNYFFTEVHIALKGKVNVEYYLPPLQQTKCEAEIEPGDVYLMYRGERVIFKVSPEGPYRHLCIIMPAPPLPGGEQLIAEQYYAYQGRKVKK
jgi:hypothetical protein